MPAAAHELLTVPDRAAWRAWLDAHEESSDGVWLVLAKKGTTDPTSLTYAEALDEALCSGWIDGQTASIDERIFRRRFTPRRKASLWSERNIGLVATLTAEGRMRPAGIREVERAQADGRWDRAYAGQASAAEPEDLTAALAASPAVAATFAALTKVNRYAVIHRVTTAPNATVCANRLAKLVAMLERGETPHPQ
ncbi:YdeI/OmpD-associated family protein [Clavibacter michiganensis]|uniref:YdeI/OmpD-associated family protein n=1 Tax=Clavibacter michiganensis TaxID=28447 RepID=UPI0026DBB9D7|nr:YdeI/OmpD-associated family protein [Clavibacter michiganensis]MDO4075988.1 YdeI/OmpD-associated family protein [Clavibacter michiganensis]MDO4131391.1 YdeI/OmpD-associated family protein [Clavibacter michiganensis]MDO4137709.1 YdeI/OmpD-associated family protein [Clavibacter michiganensis]